MKDQFLIIALIGVFTLLGGTFWYGYQKGSRAELMRIAEKTAETQEELFDLNEVIRKQTEALRQAERERQELIHVLEEEASVAVGSDNAGIAATGGLRRLERRWGSDSRIAN